MRHALFSRASLRLAGAAGFFSGLALAVIAQTKPTEEVVRLDPVFARGVRAPADAPAGINGLTGDGGLPRTTALIDAAQLSDYSIAHLEDLTIFIPGASNASPYGLTGVPLLRGDLGDAAQNGQRRAYNRNVFPLSFNAIESVEVIAGAPPASFGYTGGTGGLANFITKRPSFAPASTVLRISAGTWNSFDVQVDSTGALSDHVAYRLSVQRSAADRFYRLPGERSWDVYFALAWQVRPGVRWDFNAEGYWTTYGENPGTNRPTQALIDRGDYITGSSVQNGGTGSYFGNTFTPTGTTRIDGSQVLFAPGDGAWAHVWNAQLTGALAVGAGRELVSRTYFERVASEKHSAYSFYSYVPESYSLEQRVELAERREAGALVHALTWGATIRGEQRESFVDFFNEAMNAFDLTLDPATLRLPPSARSFVTPMPGRPGYFTLRGGRYGTPPSVGTGQTLHSRLFDGGLFAQDQITLPRGWSLLLGARGDALAVDSEDPIPPPGFSPARDSVSKVLPSGTVSLQWKARPGLSFYLTGNDAAAVEPSSSSGGFGLTNNRLPDVLFENRSRLLEAGVKFSSADGRARGSVAFYRQKRQRTNARFNLPDEILAQGVESAFAWQPATRLSLTGNLAYLDVRYVDGPVPGSIATVPSFDPARPSDRFGSYPSGNYALPGQPRWLANLQAKFTLSPSWSARMWGSVQGAQNLDLFGHVVIPVQQTLNASITYGHRQWEVRLDCLNLTDEFNWRPTSSPFAGADLVTRELPRHWRLSARYRY